MDWQRNTMDTPVTSAERYSSSVLEHLRVALFLVDRGGSVAYANSATSSVLGDGGSFEMSDNTLVAKNNSDNVRLQRAIRNAGFNGERETFVIADYGSAKPQLVSVTPLDSGNGQDGEFSGPSAEVRNSGRAFCPNPAAIVSALPG